MLKKLFPRLNTKASKTQGKSISLVRQPVFSSSSDSYASLAAEGYLSNAYVRRAVNIIANAAQTIPLVAKDQKGELLPDNHELQRLLTRYGGGFIGEIFSYLMLSGNNYMEVVRTSSGRPVELYNLRPDAMTKHPDGTFTFRNGSNIVKFEPEDIVHTYLFNPLDPLKGASPISAARRAITAHNAANDWNAGTLQNSASPSGILTTDSVLSDEAFDDLSRQLQIGWTGVNATLPKILDGGLKWQSMSMSAVDMSWNEGKESAAIEIATAFGVPPEMLALGNTTYSNKLAATVSFYAETVIPLMEQLTYDLTNVIAEPYGTGLWIDGDYSNVPTQEEAKVERTDTLRGIATLNELRAIWNLPAVEGGDVIVVPADESHD